MFQCRWHPRSWLLQLPTTTTSCTAASHLHIPNAPLPSAHIRVGNMIPPQFFAPMCILIVRLYLQRPLRAMDISHIQNSVGESTPVETLQQPTTFVAVADIPRSATTLPPPRQPMTRARSRAPSSHPQLNLGTPSQQPNAAPTTKRQTPCLNGKNMALKRIRGHARVVNRH